VRSDWVSHRAEQRERGTADPPLLMAWGSTVWTAPHSGTPRCLRCARASTPLTASTTAADAHRWSLLRPHPRATRGDDAADAPRDDHHAVDGTRVADPEEVACGGGHCPESTAVAGVDQGATAPTPGSSDLRTFFMEVFIGFVLVLVIVSMTTESRVSGAAVAVCIGLTLAACVLVAGPVSGGAANPARALGPVIVSLKFFSVWAYVFGPVVGGVLGAVMYDKFIGPATAPDEEQAGSANNG